MHEDDVGSVRRQDNASAVSHPGGALPQPGTADADQRETIEWQPLLGGVRLNVWNSDRCWKAIQTQYAFCVVHRGVAEWHYRGQTFDVAAGGVYPLEPGEVHTTRKVHRTGDFSVFFLDPAWVSQVALEVVGTEQPHFDPQGLRSVEIWKMAMRAASMNSHCEADGLSEEMSRWVSAIVHANRRRTRQPNQRINRARQMICDEFYSNPSQTVNIAAIAKEVGSGYHTLVHDFSRHFGAPPYEYVNLLRAQYVVKRLRLGPTSDAPSLAALSSAAGFSDPAHMSRNFRKHFYCSPSSAARQLHDGWRRARHASSGQS